jgi:hypothetical protein
MRCSGANLLVESRRHKAMIKDVMVHLDGTTADEMRLAAVNEIAELFHGHIVGLFLNLLPVLIAPEDGIGGIQAAELLNKAREAGDLEKKLSESLRRLQNPWNCAASIS